MYLYAKTTRDKYELPVAVAANAYELANITGMKQASARSIISKLRHGKPIHKCWHIVEVEDEDEQQTS